MRRLLTLTLAVAMMATTIPASALAMGGDWTTFGGNDLRQHYYDAPVGLPFGVRWELETGMSASQPVVVGDRIFYVAGDCLWVLNKNAKSTNDLVIHAIDGINGGRVSLPRTLDEARSACAVDHRPERTSRSHPTYSPENGVIYVGTGDHRVLAIDPNTYQIKGQTKLPDEVVSAPLAFPGDIIVFGSADGRINVVQGLASNRPVQLMKRNFVGGRVTSSPVPVTIGGRPGFIIGGDGSGGRGKVWAYTIGPDGTVSLAWEFDTPAGVPASFAVQGDTVYFSDKTGVFYSLQMNTGRTNWPNPPRIPGFINNSPAIDIGGSHVYFTMRQNSRAGGRGTLVAIRKDTGAIDATVPLQGEGNTAPLILSAPLYETPFGNMAMPETAAVFAGGTDGNLCAFGATSFRAWGGDALYLDPMDATFEGLPGRATRMGACLRLTDIPFRDPEFWRQTSGIGTELTPTLLTEGGKLLLVGANSRGGSGMFAALEMPPAGDLALWDTRGGFKGSKNVKPAGLFRAASRSLPENPRPVPVTAPVVAGDPGEPVAIPLAASALSTLPEETTTVEWWWESKPDERHRIDGLRVKATPPPEMRDKGIVSAPVLLAQAGVPDTPVLLAGAGGGAGLPGLMGDFVALTPVGLSVPSPDRPDNLIVVVNPGLDQPKHEVWLFNNAVVVPVVPARPNLAAHDIWHSPADVGAGDTVKVSVAVKNDPSAGWDKAIDTTVAWYVDGREMGQVPVAGLAPGEDRRVVLGTFTAPNARSVTVRAVVNPGRDAPPGEATWDDNTAERQVPIRLQDLTIYVDAPAEVYITGSKFPVAITVSNMGNRPLTPKVVLTEDGRTVWSKSVTVPAGGDFSETLWFRPQMLGTVTFTGVVDPDNRIPEANENNNRYTARTRILPNPNVPPPPPPDDGLKAVQVGG